MAAADPIELSRTDARRLAVRAQLLDRPRPTELFEVVRRLTMLQYDQTAVVAPSADLVLWSRIGSAYRRSELADALAEQRLIELRGMIRPAEDLALYRAEMAGWLDAGPEQKDYELARRDWVLANDRCRQDVLERLRQDGPLPARELPDTCTVPWRSSGWNNNRNLGQLLDLLVLAGEVAVAGRDGRDRLWDLADRVYPDDPVPPADQAIRLRDERRLRSLGIARPTAPECPVEPGDVGRAGVPAVVAGVRGGWRADAELLDSAGDRRFAGRAALLSPLDRLVFDRRRTVELFEFDYQLEMYKPAARRRWGYWTLPILYGDRLVGKLDATADRPAGVLRVDAVHQDTPFSRTMTAAVHHEIVDLARWLQLDLVMSQAN